MKLIKTFSWAVAPCFFIAFLFAQDSIAEKTQICFFELGNTKTSSNFESKIQDFSVETHKYSINCPEKNRCNVKSAFEKMIKDNKKCSALVISGHHTGDWFSDQYSETSLSLKDMEQLSCLPENKNWFSNIKALWLDGCNTVTDNIVKRIKPYKTADTEAVRVLDKKDSKKLNRRYMEVYGQSYAGALDELAPLSSRYLRMFPNTQIYGFNGAAPAAEGKGGKDQVGGSSFIYDHIFNLGKSLGEEQNNNAFKKGLNALFNSDLCDPEAIEQWEEVTKGQAKTEAVENLDYKDIYRLGCDLILAQQIFDDPNSVPAQKALAEQVLSDSQYKGKLDILAKANKILKDPSSEEAVELAKIVTVKTLENIKNNSYSHLLFNNVYDTWNTAKRYKTRDSSFFGDVQSLLKQSFALTLKKRIDSPYTPLLKKGDYLKFYSDIHELKPSFGRNWRKARFVKEHTNQLIKKAEDYANSKGKKSGTKRVLAVSVVDQLLQYDFLNKDQIESLKSNKNLFPENTKNSFIKDTQLKLEYTLNPDRFVSERLSSGNQDSREGVRVIKLGTEISLRQLNFNRIDVVKKRLAELVQFTDVENIESAGSSIFLDTFHVFVSSLEDEEKVKWIYDLSKNADYNLENLMLEYAEANLNKESKQSLCQKMTDNTHPNNWLVSCS